MKKKKYRVLSGEAGNSCPRCGGRTEVRVHTAITEKHLRQPWYYSRWFYCTNPRCRTTLIMPARYIVRRVRRRPQLEPELSAEDDIVMAILNEGDRSKPPWED